jgi:hypothetical protein
VHDAALSHSHSRDRRKDADHETGFPDASTPHAPQTVHPRLAAEPHHPNDGCGALKPADRASGWREAAPALVRRHPLLPSQARHHGAGNDAQCCPHGAVRGPGAHEAALAAAAGAVCAPADVQEVVRMSESEVEVDVHQGRPGSRARTCARTRSGWESRSCPRPIDDVDTARMRRDGRRSDSGPEPK